ncbi:hypothetical protein B0H13DRAFT_1892522 [Mycena leptocephala]|nr:hypothetical protein B0H13DRAFT_1892522 [Mycena leptocephala]
MGPEVDQDMSESPAPPLRRDEGERGFERVAKRVAVATPRRDLLDEMRKLTGEKKLRIQQLEIKLQASRALAKEMEENAQFLVQELEKHKIYQGELESQFMTDQAALQGMASLSITQSFERAAGSIVEAQKQLMSQNETIQRLQREMADRTIENIVHIPLDPVPLPDPPASSSQSPQDAPWVKATVTKKWSKPVKEKPRKPESQEEVAYWNSALRKPIYQNFGVKNWSDFMNHVPVTPQERKASIVPAENDWHMDFSEGYNSSHWNIALRKRIVAQALKAHVDDHFNELVPIADADWLDAQVKTKFQAMRGAWVRLLPKPKASGGMEMQEEAAARTMVTMEAEHNKRKSNSAKDRIKAQKGEEDLGTWERLLAIVQKLGTIGMSSEEEDEVELEGEPTKIYRVKICIWRNPDIVDYMRFIDVQRDLEAKQVGNPGPNKTRRKYSQDIGMSRAPTGLPRCIYNNDWLEELLPLEYEGLQVSKEAFEMFVATTSRML